MANQVDLKNRIHIARSKATIDTLETEKTSYTTPVRTITKNLQTQIEKEIVRRRRLYPV